MSGSSGDPPRIDSYDRWLSENVVRGVRKLAGTSRLPRLKKATKEWKAFKKISVRKREEGKRNRTRRNADSIPSSLFLLPYPGFLTSTADAASVIWTIAE